MLPYSFPLVSRLLNRAKAGKVMPITSQQFASLVIGLKDSGHLQLLRKMACRFQSFGAYGRLTTGNRQGLGGKLYFLKHLSEAFALLAKRLSACSLAKVFLLNIVPSVALRVVVVNILLNGVPRRFLSHIFLPCFRASIARHTQYYQKCHFGNLGSAS